MQIQSASIPIANPTPKSAVNPSAGPQNSGVTESTKPNEQKTTARPQTADRTETGQNTQFAPVSQPFAQSEANRSYAANQEGGAGNKPINLYQQVAQQSQSQSRENQPGLFGIDVYV